MTRLKQNIHGKKLTAIFTLACFFLSSVTGQVLAVAVDDIRQSENHKASEQHMLIPPAAGRITDAGYYGDGKVVVVIQDLHCHAEVQRNISAILKALDTRYGLSKVYQEGAFGTVDT